jgi:Surface-adhesin protein E
MTALVDVDSIKRRDGQLTAWSKIKYSFPEKDRLNSSPYSSELQLYAYDCDGERYTILSTTEFSGPDANGDPVGAALAGDPHEEVTEGVVQLVDVRQHSHGRSM